MENFKGDSAWEMSSTFRPFETGCTIQASTASLEVRDDEMDEDCSEGRAFRFSGLNKLAGGGSTANEIGDISLREWLDKPGRSIDQLECLHIFQQVVEAVSLAHSHSVVVSNVRPSCFVMSTFNRVSFIESASCSSSGSESSFEEALPMERLVETQDLGGGVVPKEVGERKNFPLKEILVMESNWYTSPEEAAGEASAFVSDIYKLGVLLFELFCVFDALDEKLRTMSNLRHRVLPPQLLLRWPKVASFCLWLLHPQPNSRPKMSEVLHSEFLNERRDSLQDRKAVIRLKEEIDDQELLLEFLLQLQQRKQESANRLRDTISFLSADTEEVVSQMCKGGNSELEKDEHSATEKEIHPLTYLAINDNSTCLPSLKRFKPGHWETTIEETNESRAEGSRSEAHSEVRKKVLAKSSRLMKNFKKLEVAYFSSRGRLLRPSGKHITRVFPAARTGRVSTAKTEGSSVDDLASKEGHSDGKSEWISPFLQDLCRYLSYSKLNVRADLKQGDLLSSSNLVCSLAFDRDKEYFATAGVNRKIKIFECDMLLSNDRDIHYPVVEMASRSKLSNICWNSYIKSQIASSDFEGVVQVWDVTRSQVVAEMREHERRVWSVDFSLSDPTKLASGSDDGTVKLWNINQGGSISTIRTKANVCSVQFPPDSAHLLAIGSADHNVYCYDLRNLRVPWCTLVGHTKTVSYVKFVDSTTLVSASTDNSLKLWNLHTNTSRVLDNPHQTFTGHTNVKNFVGLSVFDGYIATGSETNEVFVYHKSFPMPVLSYKFNSTDPITEREADDPSQFISSVCWRGQSPTLVAANSSGNVKVLEMI